MGGRSDRHADVAGRGKLFRGRRFGRNDDAAARRDRRGRRRARCAAARMGGGSHSAPQKPRRSRTEDPAVRLLARTADRRAFYAQQTADRRIPGRRITAAGHACAGRGRRYRAGTYRPSADGALAAHARVLRTAHRSGGSRRGRGPAVSVLPGLADRERTDRDDRRSRPGRRTGRRNGNGTAFVPRSSGAPANVISGRAAKT